MNVTDALTSAAKGAAAGAIAGPVGAAVGGIGGLVLDIARTSASRCSAAAGKRPRTGGSGDRGSDRHQRRRGGADSAGAGSGGRLATAGAASDDHGAAAGRGGSRRRGAAGGDLALLQADAADRAGARGQTAALVQARSRLAWAPAVLSGIILVVFGSLIFVVLTKPSLPENGLPLANVLLGTVAAMATQVANYWLGSSSGSAVKSDQMAALSVAAQNLVPSDVVHRLMQQSAGARSRHRSLGEPCGKPRQAPVSRLPSALRRRGGDQVVRPPRQGFRPLPLPLWFPPRGSGQSRSSAGHRCIGQPRPDPVHIDQHLVPSAHQQDQMHRAPEHPGGDALQPQPAQLRDGGGAAEHRELAVIAVPERPAEPRPRSAFGWRVPDSGPAAWRPRPARGTDVRPEPAWSPRRRWRRCLVSRHRTVGVHLDQPMAAGARAEPTGGGVASVPAHQNTLAARIAWPEAVMPSDRTSSTLSPIRTSTPSACSFLAV